MKKAVKVICAVVLITGSISAAGVYRYTSNVPKITPKHWIADIRSSDYYRVEELTDIKCKGDYEVELRILDTNIKDCHMSESNKDVFYAGDEAGYIHLLANGRGNRSEYGKEAEFYVYTLLGEEQTKDLEAKLKALFTQVDNDVCKNYLKDEEAEVQHAVATLYLSEYNTNGKQISPTFYTEYKKSDGTAEKLTVESSAVLNGENVTLEYCNADTDKPQSDGLCTVDVMQRIIDNCCEAVVDPNVVQEHSWQRLNYRNEICAAFSPEPYLEDGRCTAESTKFHSIEYAADVLKNDNENE